MANLSHLPGEGKLASGKLAINSTIDKRSAHPMYSKTQRNLMIGYIAFVIVTILVRHGGVDRHTSTPLDLILGAPIPFGFGVFAIQNGRINTRYSNVDREDSPVSYWFYVALALSVGVGMFLWGIRDTLRSMH